MTSNGQRREKREMGKGREKKQKQNTLPSASKSLTQHLRQPFPVFFFFFRELAISSQPVFNHRWERGAGKKSNRGGFSQKQVRLTRNNPPVQLSQIHSDELLSDTFAIM